MDVDNGGWWRSWLIVIVSERGEVDTGVLMAVEEYAGGSWLESLDCLESAISTRM
jgi:hypothetical protein